MLKNEKTLESLTEYGIIYTHFSYFIACLNFFLQGLINLKNYDDRLYVNVDDLAVWASDFLYRKDGVMNIAALWHHLLFSLYISPLPLFFAD